MTTSVLDSSLQDEKDSLFVQILLMSGTTETSFFFSLFREQQCLTWQTIAPKWVMAALAEIYRV